MKYHIRHILCNIALVFIGELSMATTNKLNFFRFFFISILGVLLHFTYEWSDDNRIVGLFSAVNESTWEHLKLLFFRCFCSRWSSCSSSMKNASQLPLGAYPRNLVRHDFYCRSFLYTEWYPRNKLRLDQYCTIFCRRYLRPLRGK